MHIARNLERRGHFIYLRGMTCFLLKQSQQYTDVYYFCTLVREGDSAGQRKKREQSILVQLDKHLIQQAVDLTNQLSVVRSDLSLSDHIKHGLQLAHYSQTLRHQVYSNHYVT